MPDSKQKPKDCAKNLGEVWSIVTNYLQEFSKKERGSKLHFSELLPKLTVLESSLGEEYYIFVQMKTLQLMTKEINHIYSINLMNIKGIFESIIKDEEHHREILAKIKDIIDEKPTSQDNTPKVKYQNPDAWSRSLPPATYNSM